MDKRPLEETSPTVLAVLRQPGSLAMPAAVVLGQARAQAEQSRYVREVDRLSRGGQSAWVQLGYAYWKGTQASEGVIYAAAHHKVCHT